MEHSVSSPARDRACSSDSLCEMKGLRLIDMQELLASVTRRASCNVCGSGLTVRENLGILRGLCTKLTHSCTNPLCTGVEDAFSDPYKHSKASNSRFILAGRMCGRGSAGLETIRGVMGLPPPVFPKSYSTHNSILQKIAHDVGVESCRSASAQLHRLQGADPGDVVDVTVTCDGIWSRCGFVAAYGVVAVLSWETGQVLDVTVLRKSCKVCKEAERTTGSESQGFLDWMEKHQDSCNSNFTGSSPAMEAEGASILWERSVEKNQLRYMVVISDGDANTISRLNREHPYGSDVVIQVITFMVITYLFTFMVITYLFTFMVITYLFTFMTITYLFTFMVITYFFTFMVITYFFTFMVITYFFTFMVITYLFTFMVITYLFTFMVITYLFTFMVITYLFTFMVITYLFTFMVITYLFTFMAITYLFTFMAITYLFTFM